MLATEGRVARLQSFFSSRIARMLTPLIAAGTFAASILFADFGARLREHSYLWVLEGRPPIDWLTTGFWLLVVILFGIVLLQQDVVDKQLSRERDGSKAAQAKVAALLEELDSKTGKVIETVQVLPPSVILWNFAALHPVVHSALVNAPLQGRSEKPPEVQAEELRGWIRTVLRAVAVFIRDYDNAFGATSRTVYCANLMIYRPESTLRGALRDAVAGRIRFTPDGEQSVNSLRGVLDLAPELSASTRTERNDPDALDPLALPIPKNTDGDIGGDSLVLPGAPEAFVSSQPRIVLYDAERMAALFREGNPSDNRARIADELHRYFSGDKGKAIRSVASIQIAVDGEPVPAAVLNLHCPQSGLLSGTPHVDRLYHLLRPACLALVELARALDKLPTSPGLEPHNHSDALDAGAKPASLQKE
jgi:hypothetical protein